MADASPADLVLIILASWRLGYLLVMEGGPLLLIDRARGVIRANARDDKGLQGDLFSCIMCMSFWTTLFVALTWQLGHLSQDWVRVVGVWGGASALHLLTREN